MTKPETTSGARAQQLVAEGRVSPDGAVARIAAREAAAEELRLAQVRRDRRNALRRARRAAGKGTRPAGGTAPEQLGPEPQAPAAAPVRPPGGLVLCGGCDRRVSWLGHDCFPKGRVVDLSEADHARSASRGGGLFAFPWVDGVRS